ncbi:type I polyketide synthase [Amycolatopsis sp. CA-230715]|uniref:type I polyketide synthase n=1 Tax=Amycolatopsis sp. CA-230715 TaxID=2745196 RepID=UPI001C009549|nr:type I polyketide synthase [Amycolatopsis sp. CA-230715]QWF84066.1 hypothetical protein HUW46_07510 [Amycolatopsis sp. CA-230715]
MTDRKPGRIAVVGMACRYPDAASPDELWQNVLAGRRAFRLLPDGRTPLADYYSPDRDAPDRFYSPYAALLEGYEFDRVGYRIAGSTYRSTDLTHWLALDMAARALADAGFPDGDGLPRENTAVIVGNTLTGEFSRASLLRLRWPYVRRTVVRALRESSLVDTGVDEFLDGLESAYKAPFPPVGADTLAGGLANTIAGRICNYFDLGGGGYTVDGACSSSLLSVAHACTALTAGDAEVAVAGGVDLSIDPFELVGFAKTGALAAGEMRVYDRRSAGFWPGEGCGMLVLTTEEAALARGQRVYALIAGWGVSSDGSGGITRPEVAGQRLAMERAYARARFGAGTVGYLEGHGTGTAVGDTTEIGAITATRTAADPAAPRAVLGTVKANIGHTKAAAGAAGLIKAVLAVHRRTIPPTTGCLDPHPALAEPGCAVRVTDRPEDWPADRPVRAGVSSMGFGGINAHIVIEDAGAGDTRADPRATALARSTQDAELLLFDAETVAELRAEVSAAVAVVRELSYANLADLAARLHDELTGAPVRGAVVAANPRQAARALTELAERIDAGAVRVVDDGMFLGESSVPPRIVFAFPGQGSGPTGGSALRRRFAEADRFHAALDLPVMADAGVSTAAAQPRIAADSAAALRVLTSLGVDADRAVGHSLGELTALHWAGVLDAAALVRIAAERGRLMTEASHGEGAMISVAAAPEEAKALCHHDSVVIAGLNAPRQTVLAGPAAAIGDVLAEAERRGVRATRLPVSHAFHSPQVAPAARLFTDFLSGEPLRAPRRRVISTVSAAPLTADTDLRDLLGRQVSSPVRFAEAIELAAGGADLIVEVGPGRVLSGLARETVPVPVVSTDAGGASMAGTLRAAAAAYVLGAPVRLGVLFEGRYAKPLPEHVSLLENPCETGAPDREPVALDEPEVAAPRAEPVPRNGNPVAGTVELIRGLAAERAELPVDAVDADSALLDELHLSSITVGQIVHDAVRARGLPAPAAPLNFATATVREIAQALEDLAETGVDAEPSPASAAGVAPWVRPFTVELEPAVREAVAVAKVDGAWELHAPPDHPVAGSLHRVVAGSGSGVMVCLPEHGGEDLSEVLAAAKTALAEQPKGTFLLVHHGSAAGAVAMAKSLALEAPALTVLVVEVPPVPEAAGWIAADVASASEGYTELRYDSTGARTKPVLRVLDLPEAPSEFPLDAGDVLLVTGGGKGITAECALDLAVRSGASVGLLGRSDPERDTELAENLRRFTAAGVPFRYLRADVADGAGVRSAVAELRTAFGQVTAVLHGAGRNSPRALSDVDDVELARTMAPKVSGLREVLDAVGAAELRLLVTFGSIIGRAGLAGEAHYAAANAALSAATEEFAREHPGCRCRAVEWSVWSGVGMGERLGVVESLRHNGITPVSADEGLALLRRLLAAERAAVTVVVAGRLGALPTVEVGGRELPLRRFADRVLVDYPGVELVTEAELSVAADPYLLDHELDGALLFPAVLGMEAMAQLACAVTGQTRPPWFTEVEFSRPIVAPHRGQVTVRTAALVTGPGVVEVVLRSAETGFQVDHFRATCRFTAPDDVSPEDAAGLPLLALDPSGELYGRTLFQGGRFQRLRGYRRVGATYATAELSDVDEETWFGRHLPAGLVLGSPGVRDAVMQAIQCCRPDQTLLPVGIERLRPGPLGSGSDRPLVLTGAERLRTAAEVVWDITVSDADGRVVEAWRGLRLRVVRTGEPWPLPVPLLGPYLERHVEERTGVSPRIALEPHPEDSDRPQWTSSAVGRLLGAPVVVSHRADGKPETPGGERISLAHGAGMTMAALDATCDVEPVVRRDAAVWRGLLGEYRYEVALRLARELGEDLSVAASRVWCAAECAQKAGHGPEEAFVIAESSVAGWAWFTAGTARIGTCSATVSPSGDAVVLAVRVAGAR